MRRRHTDEKIRVLSKISPAASPENDLNNPGTAFMAVAWSDPVYRFQLK